MNRVRNFKLILWMITGFAAAAGAARYIFGLGPATNLTDATPWGLWIGFDVMSGVALAAGGFVITASVYIFKLDKFHEITRPAVLTAFLGYIAVAVGLLFDLGLPWNIWHMIIYWNPHSPLFEVGWCVMLYLAVLALEFIPVPLEEFPRLGAIRNFLVKFRLPLVIIGIALSTLHQSSLGSLFLIMPYRVHPLWYTSILPILFFISAIGLGLMMVTFESNFTAWLYKRKPETALLGQLGNAARWVFILYLVVRFGDLAARGQLGLLNGSEWQVKLFWFELLIMAIIPIIMLSIPKVRNSLGGQWTYAIMGVTGVVLNRIDVGGLTHIDRTGSGVYLPMWTEIVISAGVVSLAALVFLFMVERFKIWEKRPADPQAEPQTLPEFTPVFQTWLGDPVIAARTRYSLAFVLATAIGFALVTHDVAKSKGVDPSPVQRSRGSDTLWVDGNTDGFGVAFKHAYHMKILGETSIDTVEGVETVSVDVNTSCALCHHMNLPRDQNSGCYACHADMYSKTDAMKHEWHSSPQGANLACRDCHAKGGPKSADNAKKCDVCHSDLFPSGATIKVEQYEALSYTDAMHTLCVDCHRLKADDVSRPDLAQCAICHSEQRSFVDENTLAGRYQNLVGKSLILP
ncbi:Ni/Fe-hydrogenase cytochrome b subunit [bacterium]|nr:Ni/Fe-hydrogenase cytochrome b subunit [bacterium]